jgi:hypothetical protein
VSARLLVLLIAWTTFAFAGVYLTSLIGPALLCGVLGAMLPLRIASINRAFVLSFGAIAALTAVQLLPLPTSLVARLSPMALQAWQRIRLSPAPSIMPFSIDPAAGAWALGVMTGIVVVFLIGGRIFESGGVRIVARGVSGIGLVLSAIALAQDATAHGLMYWRWRPIEEGAPPFGPFVDRNHFATWVILAIPLCLGYLVAHAGAHRRHETPGTPWRRGVTRALDARAIWLMAAACLMFVALVASLSRSGLVGISVALVAAALMRSARPGTSAARRWIVMTVGFALIAIAIRGNPGTVIQRFSAAGPAVQDRVAIWRETLPVVKDFWLTGTGAGTFETVMLVYQRSPSLFRINAAHNHYLQVAAEGGLLVGLPVLAAIALFIRAAVERLGSDRSGMYWIRVGAMSGLTGIAAQSVWETGLTTPANGVLAAIAAAVVLHRAAPEDDRAG